MFDSLTLHLSCYTHNGDASTQGADEYYSLIDYGQLVALYIGRNVSEELAVSFFIVVLFLTTKATSSLETFGDRVIQKERSAFWEMISAIVRKKNFI